MDVYVKMFVNWFNELEELYFYLDEFWIEMDQVIGN